jgi:ferredoxin
MTVVRILIDEETCVGAGQCVAVAPDVFDQREDDGRSIVRARDLTPVQVEAVREVAARLCPSRSIRVVEDETSAAG